MSIAILFERQEPAEELILSLQDIFSPIKPKSLFIYSEECPAQFPGGSGISWFQLLPRISRAISGPLELKGSPKGVLVRNYEDLSALLEMNFQGDIVADSSLYSFNSNASEVLMGLNIKRDTAPLELSLKEMEERGVENSEVTVYGRAPLMVSAQCLTVTGGRKCQKKSGFAETLTDRKGISFPVQRDCRHCCNTIYNSVPLSLHKEIRKLKSLKPAALRFTFTNESTEEITEILHYFVNIMLNTDTKALRYPISRYTSGHFRKGVE